MSRLTALKKQIAALEAQAERIAKEEMSSAISKIKAIMAEFNVTIEHLTQAIGGKRRAKQTKASSVAKYADPKTGKTWSGFGRAPAWIAGAKNRDAFLVDKSAAREAGSKVTAAAKEASAKPAKEVKAAKKAAKPVKRAVAPAKKVSKAKSASVAVKKKAAIKKVAPKKSAPKQVATAPVEPAVAPAA